MILLIKTKEKKMANINEMISIISDHNLDVSIDRLTKSPQTDQKIFIHDKFNHKISLFEKELENIEEEFKRYFLNIFFIIDPNTGKYSSAHLYIITNDKTTQINFKEKIILIDPDTQLRCSELIKVFVKHGFNIK
jgi:hypothetical protein